MRATNKRFGICALFVIGVQWAAVGTASADLVTNGGFETGTFDGWTQGGDTRFMFLTTTFQHSGTYAAQFAGVGRDSLLSQTLATVSGQTYQISYWLKGDGGTPNDFSVSFGGQPVQTDPANEPAFGYTNFTFDVTATSTSSVLEFAARDDPGYYYLDDVSVTSIASSTPEPGSIVLVCTGLASVGGFGWMKRRKLPVVAP